MTYSLTEKEEILYERQIDELFDLTEASPLTSPEKSKLDPTGKLIDPATAWRLRKADASDHYTDMYKWPEADATGSGRALRVDGDGEGESDPFDVPEVPVLLPTIPKKVKRPVPKKPKPKPKLISLTKPKDKTSIRKKPKNVPKLTNRIPPIVTPIREPKPIKKIKSNTPRLQQTSVKQLKAPVNDIKKPILKLSPNNQKAAKIAQEEIDRIIKKLQNNKTTLKQGTKLLTQLGKLEQLKPLRLNIPKTQIPKRFLTKPKLDAPKLKLPTFEPPKVPKLDAPKIELPKLKVTTPELPKSSEKDRIAKIANDAVKKVKTVDTSTAHLVGDDGKPIDDKKTKIKTKIDVDPLPKSKLGQGMVQPRPREGIKAFAKRLKFDSVEEFEKANPKGVGVDKKTGNKFVKTGVSYINKAEVDRIAIGKAGKANELDNAKRLLDKERNKPPKKQNKVRIDKLKNQVDNLEAEVKGKPKVKPGEVIKGGDKSIKLTDLRSRTNPHRLADETKMLFKRGAKSGRKLAGKMAAKAGGYLVPGLNVAIIAYDIHELMLGTANAGEDALLRQDNIMELNAVLTSNATAEEKKEMINSQRGWQWDSDNDENDPPYPVLDENEKEIDAHKMSSADLESKLPGMLAGTPHAQKDIDVIIQRVLKMKEYDLQVSPHQVKDKKAYLNEFKAKLSILKKIKSTLPETRLDSIKNYLTVAVDKNEEQWEQVRSDLAAGKITLDDAKEFFDKDGNDVRPSLSQAIANARVKDKEEREERRAKEKEEEEPGFWQRGYDAVADIFTGDDEEATASMGVAPSKNNDPEVVTTVGSPYGSPGAPKDFEEYENLMRTVAGEFDLPLPVVRALAMQESGMHATGGTLSPWSYTGDHTLGKKGAFGPFHVRSDPDKGAALEHYNEVKGTNHTWKDIATNGMLAARVGATYFKHWYNETDGDAQKAYELYNGGPHGYMKTKSIANAKIFAKKLKRFTESKIYIQKSAILEGIAKAA